jgi:hypothetical protein
MITDDEYFRRRAQEEREAAMKAEHPEARQSHMNLADAYDVHARNLAAEGRRSAMRVIRSA